MSDLRQQLQSALGTTYTLERELGGGGMSRVFVATENALGRKVVIKVLPPEMGAGVNVERFRREIQLAASLQHPHIVPLHAAGSQGDLLYFTMPFIEGESLRVRLANGGELPVQTAVRILRDVADALAYAHSHGVVHRDIKPDNVLLSGQHALVTDFGVARALESSTGESSLTSLGVALGTPAYMAPEQAAADPHIDHRADIYAFGCLAYETLTGKPPFAGMSPQQMLAAHVTQQPDPVGARRQACPPALAALITRCLEKARADRPQTAAEVHEQLELIATPSGGSQPTTAVAATVAPKASVKPKGRWWKIGTAAAAVVVGVAGFAMWRGSSAGGVMDANLVAVAPFDVLDPKLEIWHEGMVDILARALDGAGPLRTVAPSMVINHWSGRADPSSAKALGERSQAGLVVFGSLIATGQDSVRANVTLFDTRTGKSLGEVERRGLVASMDRLVDSVAYALLTQLSRTRSVGAFKQTGLGGHSLLALKAFLQGEQFMRAAAYDSALGAYQQAIALDSAFPQALSRAALAIGWSKNPFDPVELEYQLRAGQLNHGLSPRDSLLTVLDSVAGANPDEPGLAWTLQKRGFAALDELVRRYPEDPETWYGVGESRWHDRMGPGINVTYRQILEAFDRAIALDSAFAPAYSHAIQLALELDGPDRAMVYVKGMRKAMRQDPPRLGSRMTEAALLGQRDLLLRLIDSASAFDLSDVAINLGSWSDSLDALRLVLESAARGRNGEYLYGAPATITTGYRDDRLLYRGHLQAVCAGWRETQPRQIGWCALLGAVPADSFRQLAQDRWEAARRAPTSGREWAGVYWVLPWLAGQRDVATLSTIDQAMVTAQAGNPPNTFAGLTSRYMKASVSAYLALARGDSAGALARFKTLPDSLCPSCYQELLARAELQVATHDAKGALQTLEFSNRYRASSPHLVIWELTRARAAEELGDREVAIRSYSLVVHAWEQGEPPVQPYVAEAKAGLERLVGERKE